MFVSPAYAQAGAAPGGFDPGVFVPLILIFVVFYFLLIRPQQKKMKQHRDMVSALRRGDRIVTAGGLVGTITKVVDDKEVMVELAEGVRVRVVRSTIAEVLTKPQPAAEGAKPGPSGADKKADKKKVGRASRKNGSNAG